MSKITNHEKQGGTGPSVPITYMRVISTFILIDKKFETPNSLPAKKKRKKTRATTSTKNAHSYNNHVPI
jgi:hypothetical protein